MAEKLRFGIVGCGVIGPTHAEAIASLPDAQLVAVTDIDAEKAQKLAGRYGATPYTSPQTMLDREQLDVVNICTPSATCEPRFSFRPAWSWKEKHCTCALTP